MISLARAVPLVVEIGLAGGVFDRGDCWLLRWLRRLRRLRRLLQLHLRRGRSGTCWGLVAVTSFPPVPRGATVTLGRTRVIALARNTAGISVARPTEVVLMCKVVAMSVVVVVVRMGHLVLALTGAVSLVMEK